MKIKVVSILDFVVCVCCNKTSKREIEVVLVASYGALQKVLGIDPVIDEEEILENVLEWGEYDKISVKHCDVESRLGLTFANLVDV